MKQKPNGKAKGSQRAGGQGRGRVASRRSSTPALRQGRARARPEGWPVTAACSNSRFHHRPDPAHRPNSKLEAAYHKADAAIQNIVDLLAAA